MQGRPPLCWGGGGEVVITVIDAGDEGDADGQVGVAVGEGLQVFKDTAIANPGIGAVGGVVHVLKVHEQGVQGQGDIAVAGGKAEGGFGGGQGDA